jgi:hypothetical protein
MSDASLLITPLQKTQPLGTALSLHPVCLVCSHPSFGKQPKRAIKVMAKFQKHCLTCQNLWILLIFQYPGIIQPHLQVDGPHNPVSSKGAQHLFGISAGLAPLDVWHCSPFSAPLVTWLLFRLPSQRSLVHASTPSSPLHDLTILFIPLDTTHWPGR